MLDRCWARYPAVDGQRNPPSRLLDVQQNQGHSQHARVTCRQFPTSDCSCDALSGHAIDRCVPVSTCLCPQVVSYISTPLVSSSPATCRIKHWRLHSSASFHPNFEHRCICSHMACLVRSSSPRTRRDRSSLHVTHGTLGSSNMVRRLESRAPREGREGVHLPDRSPPGGPRWRRRPDHLLPQWAFYASWHGRRAPRRLGFTNLAMYDTSTSSATPA